MSHEDSSAAPSNKGTKRWAPGSLLERAKNAIHEELVEVKAHIGHRLHRHSGSGASHSGDAQHRGRSSSPSASSDLGSADPEHRQRSMSSGADGPYAGRRGSDIGSGSETVDVSGLGWAHEGFGKLLLRRARKALSLQVDRLEQSNPRYDGARKVGELHLRCRGTRGVKHFNPYLEVQFEGTKRVIKAQDASVAGSRGSRSTGSDPQWDDCLLTFDITDVTADVHVNLMEKLLRTTTVGSLILPLVNFYGLSQPLPPATYVFDLVSPDLLSGKDPLERKYQPQMVIMTGNDAETPPWPAVGQVIFDIEIVTKLNLIEAYLVSRPLDNRSFVKTQKTEEAELESVDAEEFDLRAFIVNIYRLKRAFKTPPLVSFLLDYPIICVPFYTKLCLFTAHYTYPLYLASLICLNGWLSSGKMPITELEVYPRLLVEKVIKARHTRGIQRIRRLKALLTWMTHKLGTVDSTLERSANMFNFSDARITTIVDTLLFAGAVLVTVVLYLIPIRWLVWVLGLCLYGGVRKTRQRPEKETGDAAAGGAQPQSDAKVQPQVPQDTPNDGASRTERAPSTASRGGAEAQEEDEMDVFELGGRNRTDPGHLLSELLHRVIVRTPDYPELAHRVIAQRRGRVVAQSTGASSDNPKEE